MLLPFTQNAIDWTNDPMTRSLLQQWSGAISSIFRRPEDVALKLDCAGPALARTLRGALLPFSQDAISGTARAHAGAGCDASASCAASGQDGADVLSGAGTACGGARPGGTPGTEPTGRTRLRVAGPELMLQGIARAHKVREDGSAVLHASATSSRADTPRRRVVFVNTDRSLQVLLLMVVVVAAPDTVLSLHRRVLATRNTENKA